MSNDPIAVASAVLGRPVARAHQTARTPIAYDPYLAGRHVERATGAGAIRSWLDPASHGMRGSRRTESRGEAVRLLLAVARHILDGAYRVPVA